MDNVRSEALYIPIIFKLCPIAAKTFAIARLDEDCGEARWQTVAMSDDATLTLEPKLKKPESLRLYGSHDWILEIDLKSDFIPPSPGCSAQDMMFCRVYLYKLGQRPETRRLSWPEDMALGIGGNFAAELAENEYLWLGLSPGNHRQYCRSSGEVDTRYWVFEIEISPFDRTRVLGSRSARLSPDTPILQSRMCWLLS